MRVGILLLFLLLLTVEAFSDPISGPGRSTLIREGWGAVFIDPSGFQGDYEVSVNEDATTHTIQTLKGTIIIKEVGDDVTLTYPDFKAEVVSDPGQLQIQWGEVQHSFSRSESVMTYQGPLGKVEFVKDEGQLKVTGPRGTVLLKETDGSYSVESPLGRTEYTTTPRGFKVSGPRLTEHPYLRRGALFSHGGVGIYVELALLDPANPLFKLLDWDTIVDIETTGR